MEKIATDTYTFEKLRKETAVVLSPAQALLRELRAAKSPAEQEKMRAAQRITDAVFAEMLDFIEPGMTEKRVAAELTYRQLLHGADGNSFDPIVVSGAKSSMPHGVPGENVIRKGDFLTMDFGCVYNGYCSDMTRTVVLGAASEKQQEIYNTVLRAQEAALAALRPGLSGMEIDAVARDIIKEAGYGDCFGHGLGHSVGLEIHESPNCNMRDQRILKPGMLMTVEPGIYVKDFGGVRIEDMVVITEDGYENLAHSEKKLIEL